MERLDSIKKKGITIVIAAYNCEGDGRRLSKKIGEQPINYHYDRDSINIFYEIDQTGKTLRFYIIIASQIIIIFV